MKRASKDINGLKLRKKEGRMGLKKGRNPGSFYWKGWVVLLCMIGLAGSSSCTSSTGSSSSSGSSTGSGWNISVTTSAASVSASRLDTIGVIAIVKDRNGSPAVKGTNVCLTALRGGFLTVDSSGGSKVIATMCATTTNDIGQTQATYVAAVNGVSDSGSVIQVPIESGTDTITASAMGVFGSAVIQVYP
jgi:hypothetical protein